MGIFEVEKGKMDAFDLPNIIRVLNLNPSLDSLEKMGWQQKEGNRNNLSPKNKKTNNIFFKGVKTISVEEFLPIYSQLRKEKKDQGCYEDFLECLKLYDKEENGKMLVTDLSHSLLSLGMSKKQNALNCYLI